MPRYAPFVLMMLGSVGVPYALTEMSGRGGSPQAPAGETTAEAVWEPNAPAPDDLWSQGGRVADAQTPAVQQHPIVRMPDALRKDVNIPWILSRWPRVTTGLAEIGLQGYRVAWVSGPGPEDVAGSLTYYFDPQQRLRKIAFQGTTGDPRKLVDLLVERFDFHRQNQGDPGLLVYQARWNGKVRSELKIRTATILRADSPFTRFGVSLAITKF